MISDTILTCNASFWSNFNLILTALAILCLYSYNYRSEIWPIMKFLKKLILKIPKGLRSKRVIAAVFVILAGYYFLSRGDADFKKIVTIEVERENISEGVLASGKVSADSESKIHSAVSGKVVWVGAKSGDFVKRGQLIATLDKERYEISFRQAQQDVIAADAELVKVYDDISKGDSVETFDERIKRTAAEAKKNKAYDAVKLAERNLKDTVITSPITGTVVSVNIIAGEEILPTTEVATVFSTSDIEFTAEVDEIDVVKVKTGQKVSIALDAYGGKTFDSKVGKIGQESITTSTGATAFEVEIDLQDSANVLVGMNGEASILISEVNGVLVVPIEAVIDDQYVYVKVGNTFEKKQVETGISSDLDIEVKSGLAEGELAVVSGFEEIDKKSIFQKIFKK